MVNTYDAIVVGSGISGLTTALILAKAGQRVVLFEKDRAINPLLRPYERQGCGCSPGLHITGWLEDGEALSSFLTYLNIADGVDKEIFSNGFGRIIVDSKEYHIPRGFVNLEERLNAYFPQNETAIRNYLRLIKEVNEGTFLLNHRLSPERKPFDQLSHLSLEDVLRQYQAAPELIRMLGTFNYLLTGSKASEVPFVIHAFVAGGYYQSPGMFTIGGLNRLLANFQREFDRFGVDLRVNSEVVEIVVNDERKATGIRLADGAEYHAARIIVSFNPKLLDEKVKSNGLRRIYRRRLAEAETTFGLYVAFYKIKAYSSGMIENFIYTGGNPEIVLGAIVNRSGEEQVLAVFLADEQTLISKDVGERERRAEDQLKRMTEILYARIPELQGKTILLDFLKPWSFERYTKTCNGAAYGLKHTCKSIGFGHKIPVNGLYLVGQSIYPGFLGSMVSGFSLALELPDLKHFWLKVMEQCN